MQVAHENSFHEVRENDHSNGNDHNSDPVNHSRGRTSNIEEKDQGTIQNEKQ